MKILLLHTAYQHPGGEDIVFRAEKELLKTHNHAVIDYQRSNYEAGATMGAIWSQKSYREIRNLIKKNRPDIAHFHNTFLAISPSAYYACHDEKVPAIQTLHNFRLVCPGALLLRNNQPCEDCLGRKIAWPGVAHACWRGSRTGSALTAAMLSLHHSIGTWQTKVNRYIALSEFSRQKFIQGGLPAEKIVVKPNFIPDPELEKIQSDQYALFVGRLSHEKGVDILLEAWKTLPEIPLKVIGDGPLFGFALETITANQHNQVELPGSLERDLVFSTIQKAVFLIIPSKWYESFPMVVLESFAMGIPLLVPNMGNLAKLVNDGHTGLHFTSGDAQDLAAKAAWLWQNPQEAARMGQNARREYEEKYTPETNYRQLMVIYEEVLAEKKI